jgi:Alr-MurF fusion protein
MAFSYTPAELAHMMQATLQGTVHDDLRISFLLTDSRKVTFARSAVFFALKTKKNDGHQYIGNLIKQGVSCFVVSTLPKKTEWLQQACFLLTDNTLVALQRLAAAHRARFSYPVTGITGSNGKTIVKEWLSQLLHLRVVKNPRSYNSQTGVPLSVWNMDETHQMGIFEAGISQPGEMENLEAIIRPQTGIFTNIGPAHDEGFPDTRSKLLEKLILFRNSRLLVYNSDQPLADEVIVNWSKQRPLLKLFSWGEKPDSQLQVVSIQAVEQGSLLELNYRDRFYSFKIPFSDRASIENVMHCIALIFAEGLYQPELGIRLMKLTPLALRMEMKQGINNCLIINDAYSSDILSLSIALDFLNTQAKHPKKVLILSDILQSGLKPEELYRQLAALVREKEASFLIAIGKEISSHQHCFTGIDAVFFSDTESFLREFDVSSLNNMGILIKGAREFGFERIGNKLQLKDHQTLLEINMDALVHNLNVYRSLLPSSTRIMGMVKAFSYGSGSYEIASLLQFHGVDYLAVAFADEGYDLRNAGISLPVVVLNPELYNLDILFRYKLEPEVYSIGLLRRLVVAIQQFSQHDQTNPFPIHIKLDTGMHRLGFAEEELNEMTDILKENPAFRVASVFSHLAASDQPQFDDFTLLQIQRFERMSQQLETALGYGFMRHLANTAAVNRFPQAQYDMVRLGIGLYGIDGSKDISEKLYNVTTFKTVISQIRELAAGESVGYNRSAILSRKTRMAIVPVGYADGLNRRLSNGNGYMLVNGKKAPILGNISMDMCSLDVTGISAMEGDEVIIFGEKLPVQELASQLGTIPYEIFTSIPPRVKRIYFSE